MLHSQPRAAMAVAMFLAAGAAAQPASAAIRVLDFSGAICETPSKACSNGAAISASYGDAEGVDVSYRAADPVSGATDPLLRWWGPGFGDVEGVVWGGNSSTFSEITLKAAPGYEIALISFDFATYLGRFASSPVSIASLDGTDILSGPLSTNPGAHNHVEVASAFFEDGIRLRWGPNGYDVGMDNITFEVRALPNAPVPEPTTWAMLIAGFGGIGTMMRRRRGALAAA